jgi:hypothetical protein
MGQLYNMGSGAIPMDDITPTIAWMVYSGDGDGIVVMGPVTEGEVKFYAMKVEDAVTLHEALGLVIEENKPKVKFHV